MKKFKDKYVLAEGYPVVGKGVKFFGMAKKNVKVVDNSDELVKLNYIKELDGECPKYRLVLERIETKEEKSQWPTKFIYCEHKTEFDLKRKKKK